MSLILGGCAPSKTDVTHSPRYKFSTFSGTVWRTKVKLALADVKEYTGVHQVYLIPPDEFDPTSPGYQPQPDSRVIAVLAAGARIRIKQLWLDDGEGSVLG